MFNNMLTRQRLNCNVMRAPLDANHIKKSRKHNRAFDMIFPFTYLVFFRTFEGRILAICVIGSGSLNLRFYSSSPQGHAMRLNWKGHNLIIKCDKVHMDGFEAFLVPSRWSPGCFA